MDAAKLAGFKPTNHAGFYTSEKGMLFIPKEFLQRRFPRLRGKPCEQAARYAFKAAMKSLGFHDVLTIEEGEDYILAFVGG